MDTTHLLTGWTKGRVIYVNPSKEELEELIGEELENDVKYTWEKEGIRNCRIDIYIQDNKEENIFKHSIYLEDREDVSKTGKYKYVNCIGDARYAEEESQLFNSFTKFERVLEWENKKPKIVEEIGSKQPRIALKGEDVLLHYRRMLLNVNIYNENINLYYNMEKLFSGDFSELQNEIKTDTFHFVIFLYVNEQFEQKIWKEFLPIGIYGELNNNMSFSYSNKKIFDRWKNTLIDEKFGIQGHYSLQKLGTFKEEYIIIQEPCSTNKMDYKNNIK